MAKSAKKRKVVASGSADGIQESPVKSAVTSHKKHKEIDYEFGGPVGTFFVIVGLPIVILGLYFLCNGDRCLSNPWEFDWLSVVESLPKTVSGFFSKEACLMYLGWMAFHVLLERTLPGESAEGAVLEDGKRLKYTLSGHLQFWVTLGVVFFGIPTLMFTGADYSAKITSYTLTFSDFTRLPLELIYDHYMPLISISLLFSGVLSVYLYVHSFTPGVILAAGGNTGNAVYDFFIGRLVMIVLFTELSKKYSRLLLCYEFRVSDSLTCTFLYSTES